MTASLYIHVPFCTGTCDYCDFFSVPVSVDHNLTLLDSFTGAVLADIKDQIAFFGVDYIPTIYIGGGTPSVLGETHMERLLAGLGELLRPLRAAPTEITVEANPESADAAFLRACVTGGVNRISLGVQTFHEPSRRAVHRSGMAQSGSILEERLALAADFFPGAFSVDLITGLPFQTAAVLTADIQRALAFRPAHVSLYSLIIEAETPLGKAALHDTAGLSLPDADEADALWITGRDMLEQAGLPQYEVSNFARPGKQCAHNIRYWRMENWIGAGPAASGTVIDDAAGTGKRFTYPADIRAWLNAQGPRVHSAIVEELGRDELLRETLLMGFRYRAGPDPNSFRRRFSLAIADRIPQTIARWQRQGLFETARPALTREGLLFLNRFILEAFEEIE